MQVNPIKKITFIEPSAPGNHVFKKWGLPRLGTITLGTILAKEGYEVSVFIEDVKGIDWGKVFESDIVGISTITSTAPRAYEMADQIRKAGIPVVMGGPHVSFMPEEALSHCDFVMCGETEETICDFISSVSSGEGFEKISGLAWVDNGNVRKNPIVPTCLDLDKFPIPDFSLIHGDKTVTSDCAVKPIMTSRGCPFACNFCSVTRMFGRKYRFRSVDSVIEELRKTKAEWVFFYDDNFAANKAHTKELLTRMIEEKLTPKWMAQVRIDVANDPELLDLMIRANCKRFFIGFESINPKTLLSLKKGQTPEQIETAIGTIHAHGIKIHGMFILGCEHDDSTTVKETVKFAKRVGLSSVQFLILTPLPGTPVFEQMESEGRLISRDWSYYDAHHVVFTPKGMSFLQLQKEMIWATVKFYSLPHVLKCLNHFDIWSMLIRAYGWRLSRKSRKSMREFTAHLKDKYHELQSNIGTNLGHAKENLEHAKENLGQAKMNIELKTRKTTEDLKEIFRSINFEAIRKLRQKKHQAT